MAGAVQAVIGSKPMTAMLTPAAEVFGEHLRKRAVEKVPEWENKRRKTSESTSGAFAK
jgi:hypothetical protein